jgi:hypothetical protein
MEKTPARVGEGLGGSRFFRDSDPASQTPHRARDVMVGHADIAQYPGLHRGKLAQFLSMAAGSVGIAHHAQQFSEHVGISIGFLNGVTVAHRGFTPMSGLSLTRFDCCSGTASHAGPKHLKQSVAGNEMSPIRLDGSSDAIATRELETGRWN